MDKDKKLFPQRLWDLVHDERYNRFLRWSDDGQRVYLNRNDFEEQYLKTSLNQFHTQKAISFVRQMNMYGFKKVDDCHYENDNFKRGCHHLIKHMVRRNTNRPHVTTTSLALADGQSMNVMRDNSIGHDAGVCGGGGGGGGGINYTGGNHNSSFDQHHRGTSNTKMNCAGRLMHHQGSYLAACRQLAGDSDRQQQIMTCDAGANGGGAGGLDEGQNNNLRALYEQLVSLNQMNATAATNANTDQEGSMIQRLVRSSAQLNNLLGRNQTFITDPIAVTTQPPPTATTTATTTSITGGAPSIAHSSLASSLYQRLALPLTSRTNGYLLNETRPLTATTTLSAPHIQYAGAMSFNETTPSTSPHLTAAGLDETVRSMLATQNLIEAANRDAQLMAAAAAATHQPNRNHLAGLTMNQTRSLAAQQLLQQTLVGSLMQLRLAAQLPDNQLGENLAGAAAISQNYQDLNLLLNQNQNLTTALAQTQQQQQQQQHQHQHQTQMPQSQNSIVGMSAIGDVRMDEGTSVCDLATQSLGGCEGPTAAASYSSSSSSSSKNTSSRSSTSLNLHQIMSDEIMLRRNSDQCSVRHLPGYSGSSNLSSSVRRTGGESDSECPLVTDEDDDEFDNGARGLPRTTRENTFQFGQQQQSSQAIRPAPAHCMSRRQVDGTQLINLSCGSKRENRSV